MITPLQIEMLSSNLLDIYDNIELDLLTNIAARIAGGQAIPINNTADFDWLAQKLMEVGSLRRENIETIARWTGKATREIELIFQNAGIKSLAYDDAIYQRAYEAGLLPSRAMPITASPKIQQMLGAAVVNAKSTLNLVNTTALEASTQSYIQTVNQVYLETVTGISSYTDSVSKAVARLADNGIAGVTYVSEQGRVIKTTVDVAVRRNVVTSVGQTANHLQEQRAQDWGNNLVEVSSHMGARPEHARWQGKIYCLEGSTSKYKNLRAVTRYGEVDGLGGANCRHVFFPYVDGLSRQTYKPYNMEENDAAYELSQQQRGIERDIRKYKRREATAKAAGDDAGAASARSGVAQAQARMRDFIEETGRTRRTAREQI